MAAQPPGPSQQGTAQWWTVFYLQSQNQVSSRFVNTPSPNGAGSATGWKVVEATSSAAASAAVTAELGTGGTVTTVDGPFGSQAAAQADGQQAQSSIAQQEQAGSIPGVSGLAAIGDFLSRLTEASLWLRVLEVGAGVVLLAIAVNAMFKGKPLRVVTNTAGLAAKAVP